MGQLSLLPSAGYEIYTGWLLTNDCNGQGASLTKRSKTHQGPCARICGAMFDSNDVEAWPCMALTSVSFTLHAVNSMPLLCMGALYTEL